MKFNWWTNLMNVIKGWLDKSSEAEVKPPVVKAPIELPNNPGPMEPVERSGPFDHPWIYTSSVIVIDAYEKNPIDWDKMGTDPRVIGVIHRSADGLKKDSQYFVRRKIAKDRGYLWGAFHLGRRGDTIKQAELFLSMVDDDTLMALDLEDTSASSMMTIDEAVVFMDYVYSKTGKVPVVYANHNVTEKINQKILSDNNILRASKLWYARFKGKVTDFPIGVWKEYFLWQFSSEINCSKDGACLYNVPGTKFDMDVNVFFGNKAQLMASWNNNPTRSIQANVENTPVKEKLWFEIAKVEIGQKEITGPKHNQKILAYHAVTTLKATTDEVPWCSSFVSWCLENSGIESAKSAWARSYLEWGKKITEPVVGCIVVFKRGTDSGHVAFFVKDNGSTLTVLGGNQSNEVCYSDYKKSDVLGYRMPDGY